MLLEYLFLNVECDFYRYRLNKNLFINTNPQIASGSGLEVGPVIDVNEFVKHFEKQLFLDVPLNQFTGEALKRLDKVKEQYEKKLRVLEDLISCFAAGLPNHLI